MFQLRFRQQSVYVPHGDSQCIHVPVTSCDDADWNPLFVKYQYVRQSTLELSFQEIFRVTWQVFQ